MANIIIFTNRTPSNFETNGELYQIQRYNRPAGAYKIASTLQKHGYSVIVVPDCLSLTFEGVKQIISNNSDGLLWAGISTTFAYVRSSNINEYRKLWQTSHEQFINLDILNINFSSHDNVTQLAWADLELGMLSNYLKNTHQAKLIIGGTWITQIKDGALGNTDDNIHFVTGLAEDYTVELTNSLANKQTIPFQRTSVEEKEFKSSIIDYRETDFIEPDDWLMLEVSRGCAFKCAYCVYDHKGKADTTKHVKTLRDELIRNYELWGVTKYHLVDDLYNDSDHKVKLLYDELWSKLPFTPEWVSYLRLDLIWSTPDQAQWIEASGCKIGCFGIETLHDVAGRKVGKGLGKERILETLEHLKNLWGDRVIVNALMIAGLPYEPYDHIVETMNWLHTTDLVHSYKYNALWITPPDHKKFVLKQNDMSQDYEKYELTWGPDGWINNVGVTFKMVNELVTNDDKWIYNHHFPVDLHEYTDLRSVGGYTHEQLASKDFNKYLLANVAEYVERLNSRIHDRLIKMINLKNQ